MMVIAILEISMKMKWTPPAGNPCRSAPLFGSVPVAISSPGDDGQGGDGYGDRVSVDDDGDDVSWDDVYKEDGFLVTF